MITAEAYRGKSKCSCGRRAKFRSGTIGQYEYACLDHKGRLKGQAPEVERMTEADYQTWCNL